ncbi:MAG TPA: flagellar assembly protein FliW [Bryobacteraceae bacterium]|nr:flagellar assembly protein FliW [Bryobacteraceae bacterium]
MPHIATAYFGRLPYQPESVIDFPAGLPGFENERRFLPVELPEYHPLVFLQSLEPQGPCFPTLPVTAVEPGYELEVVPEDLERVGLSGRRQPVMGRDVLVLAVLTVSEAGITANLLAPVVVNLANRRAVQAIRPEPRYSHAHPVETAEVAVCS